MTGVLNPFWTTAYGIPDADAFATVTDPFWEMLFPVDPFDALKSAAENTAALSPASPAGIAVAGWLAASGYAGGPGESAANGVANAGAAAFSQSSGEEPPMSQLIIPDCFQVNINAVSGGQVVTNVVGVRNAGGNAAGAAAAVRTAWKVASGPFSTLNNLYALTDFRAVDIGDANGDIAVITDTSVAPGSNALATNAACALIKWNGGTRSRSSRGRLYFGPIGENNINSDGRTVASASITAYNTAFTNFRNSLDSSGYPLVVLSRSLSTAFTVTQHACESIIATQRRRIRA